MNRLFGTFVFRFAASYWLLFVILLGAVSAAVYFVTVETLVSGTDRRLEVTSERLTDVYEQNGTAALGAEINRLLNDNIDQDVEDYLVVSRSGEVRAGNIAPLPRSGIDFDEVMRRRVQRYGRPSSSRLLAHELGNGDILVVGRDMQDEIDTRRLLVNALGIGCTLALLIATGGALVFRSRLERSLSITRRTAAEIESGDLSRRIPLFGPDDEFVRLGRDVNRMLDRIEQLVDGVRDVSNAIAHDLRTPLSRVRLHLEQALQPGNEANLRKAVRDARIEIDEILVMFDKTLQIAEVESGIGRQHFVALDPNQIVDDMAELFEAMAEDKGIELQTVTAARSKVLGDRDLLGSVLANLMDNALKYSSAGARVTVGTSEAGGKVSLYVRDNGPGIPESERDKVLQRYYRIDRSRHLPGNGLGLAIVTAIAQLHWGELSIADAEPGVLAEVVLPRVA